MMALEFMHSNGIIHRDVKPENLVFDNEGYLHLTDMGIARIWKPDNYQDTSGTPGYMAPEIMTRQNHGISVDYYAVGVIVYECMMGCRPYVGRNRNEIREKILAKQALIRESEIPENWSPEAANFANQLLERKPSSRLGVNGPQEVKEHVWFQDIPWALLKNRQLQAPFIPTDSDNYYQNIKLDSITDQDGQNEILLRRNSIQNLFGEYKSGELSYCDSIVPSKVNSVSPLKTSY